MADSVRVTVLSENTAGRDGLLAEHGLAFWIEAPSANLLFDTGQGLILSQNAERLHVPLERTDAIVLSHGHYDHTGGLPPVLKAAPGAKVYIHPRAFVKRFSRKAGSPPKEVGIPPEARKALEGAEMVSTESLTEVAEGFYITGEIPRETPYEDTGGPFFLDPEGRKPDLLPDDQALFFESSEGTVVLLGCAHSGVVNTLEKIRKRTGGKPIHTVMGGMHLVEAGDARMRETIEFLRELEVRQLIPMHCTGTRAISLLWSAFPDRCRAACTGSRFEFGPVLL